MLVTALLATGCGDDSEPQGGGGSSNDGGSGGTGAAGGAGGADGGAGGSGGAPDPSDAHIELAFRNQSHGESWAIAAADLDADGSDELVLGSRGLAAFATDGLQANDPLWTVDWDIPGLSLVAGDNDWAYAVETLEIDGDDVPDFVVATSFLDLVAFSGADGSLLWQNTLEGSFPTAIALFDGDDDGVKDVFVVGDPRGFSGRTGEELWTSTVPDIMIFARPAELDGAAGGELYVGVENDTIIGPAGGGNPPDPYPTLYGLNADGSQRFAYQAGDALSALATADFDGDGRDEAIAAHGDAVDVVDADGAMLFTIPMAVDAHASRVAGAVVGGEPRVFVGVLDFFNGNRIEAYGPDGVLRWSQPMSKADGPVMLLDVIDVPGQANPVLLVGSGDSSPPTGGLTALRLEDDAVDHVFWRAEAGLPVSVVTRAHIDGEDALVFGGWSTIVQAVSPATGASIFEYVSGSFVFETATGDLDGDGVAEVVTIDDHANVRCVGADGVERWARRLSVGPAGTGTSVAVADLDMDGRAEVIAGGWTLAPLDTVGVVDVLSGEGEVIQTLHTWGTIEDVGAPDLDGDGAPEIVAAEAAADCSIVAFDGDDFEERFTTPVAPCFIPVLGFGDLDGVAGDEIGYGDATIFGDPHVAVVAGDGTLTWSLAVPETTSWVGIRDRELYFAGASPDLQGHMKNRAPADGTLVWETYLDPREDPEVPNYPMGGDVQSVSFVPDRDGDDHAELVLGLTTGEVAYMNGATGEVLWKTLLEETGRRTVGSIAYVPASETLEETLVAGQGGGDRLRCRLFSLDLEGNATSDLQTNGESHDVALGADADGGTIAYFVSGLDLWAARLVAAE